MRDVVIIGAGHNALVAACYLAKEGLDVEVVERDTVVGGACSTVERFPGYQVDRGALALPVHPTAPPARLGGRRPPGGGRPPLPRRRPGALPPVHRPRRPRRAR